MKRKYLMGSALVIGLLASVSAMAANAAPTNTKTTAPPGTQVVDSKGTVVGSLVAGSESFIERQINGAWYAIIWGANYSGLNVAASPNAIWYTSANCTGTGYLEATQLPAWAWMVNPSGGIVTTATINYPATPFQTVMTSSYFNGATCNVLSPAAPIYVGPLATQTLTVVPPLSVQ